MGELVLLNTGKYAWISQQKYLNIAQGKVTIATITIIPDGILQPGSLVKLSEVSTLIQTWQLLYRQAQAAQSHPPLQEAPVVPLGLYQGQSLLQHLQDHRDRQALVDQRQVVPFQPQAPHLRCQGLPIQPQPQVQPQRQDLDRHPQDHLCPRPFRQSRRHHRHPVRHPQYQDRHQDRHQGQHQGRHQDQPQDRHQDQYQDQA